jgi:hypothetical protein
LNQKAADVNKRIASSNDGGRSALIPSASDRVYIPFYGFAWELMILTVKP